MLKIVLEFAPQYGCEVDGVIDPSSPLHGGGPDAAVWNGVDVAVDFSSAAAVEANAVRLAGRGIRLVIGTTLIWNDSVKLALLFVRASP
jgi:dihydrodipicolinate reductase